MPVIAFSTRFNLQPDPMTIIFFDIDGTLVSMRGAGRAAFQTCIRKVFGWEDDISYIQFAGATDLDVVHQVCDHHNHAPTEEEFGRFFEHLPNVLQEKLPGFEPHIHAGGPELLQELTARDQATIGLITGNEEQCAKLKLGHCDLAHYFSLGAFGHERRHRRDIASLALDRALARLNLTRAGISALYLIGDTPSDIDAAKSIGATSIAVTSDNHGPEALFEANADHVIDSLYAVEPILNFPRA